jgi:iron complex transport system substrate-binding protein
MAFSSFTNLAYASDIERIISTDASSTDILVQLGVESALVGVDVTSQIPSSLKVRRLGYHRTLSAEGILSLNPSLVIGSEHMGPTETIESVRNAKVTVIQLPVARDDYSLKNNIKTIGALVNQQDKAKKLLEHINHSMRKIRKNKVNADTQMVFLLQMDGRSLRMAGTGTTGNDVIALLGGKNLGSHDGYQSISAEALLALEPDVIFVAGRDSKQSAVEVLLKNYPLIQYTPSGQQQNIIAVDGSSIVAGISLAAIDVLADITAQLR